MFNKMGLYIIEFNINKVNFFINKIRYISDVVEFK